MRAMKWHSVRMGLYKLYEAICVKRGENVKMCEKDRVCAT